MDSGEFDVEYDEKSGITKEESEDLVYKSLLELRKEEEVALSDFE